MNDEQEALNEDIDENNNTIQNKAKGKVAERLKNKQKQQNMNPTNLNDTDTSLQIKESKALEALQSTRTLDRIKEAVAEKKKLIKQLQEKRKLIEDIHNIKKEHEGVTPWRAWEDE